MDSPESRAIVAIQETLVLQVLLVVQDLSVLLDLLVHRAVKDHREVWDSQVCKVLEAPTVFRDLLVELVLLVLLDCRDLLAFRVSLVNLDELVHQVSLVSQVCVEISVLLVTRDRLDPEEKSDDKVNQACLGLLEPLARVDRRVLRVHVELMEPGDRLVRLVTSDHVDRLDLWVSRESLARRVRRVLSDGLEMLSLVLLELQGHRELMGLLDSQELQEVLARLDREEPLVHREREVYRALPDLRAPMENQEHKDQVVSCFMNSLSVDFMHVYYCLLPHRLFSDSKIATA